LRATQIPECDSYPAITGRLLLDVFRIFAVLPRHAFSRSRIYSFGFGLSKIFSPLGGMLCAIFSNAGNEPVAGLPHLIGPPVVSAAES
jgi:hypothetical protein